MRIIGEIKPLRVAREFNTFVWDGKEFKPKILRNPRNVWKRTGNVVESRSYPFFKMCIRGLEYHLFFPGFSQVWLLRFEPLRFESVSKGLKGGLWVFSKGIWKSKGSGSLQGSFVVEGKLPFWSILLVLLGVPDKF